MLNAWRRRAEQRRLSDSLLAASIARSRSTIFYEKLGVADTIDGRFDLLILHAWLVLDRLAKQGAQGTPQALVDGLFVQFDEALREQGAGDMGMGRRMKRMAEAFHGRLKAYGEAADCTALADAILRNVYRGDPGKVDQADALAVYAASVRARLETVDLTASPLDFGAEP
jgi:cytochrome b pre-mRNA-processing protein 3